VIQNIIDYTLILYLQPNNAFIHKEPIFMMSEQIIKESFKKVKEDIEGVKDELAFALKRIAHIEGLLNKQAIEDLSAKQFPKSSKKKK
jgi:hypothetical protein